MAVATILLLIAGAWQAESSRLKELVPKIGEYVATYGEKSSAIVGIEKYSQLVTLEGQQPLPSKRLVAEFAIVRAGNGWTGFRDVVAVNERSIEDRKNRLERLLSEMSGTESDLMRIASENARYNVGPIARNLNVPTAALFFFQPANLSRFTFVEKGTKKIDGIETIEIEFKETRRPTLVMRRNGSDVPMEGSLWVVPADGTVVRTRLHLKNFADVVTLGRPETLGSPPPPNPNVARGGATRSDQGTLASREFETNAEIEVTYRKHAEFGLWLPSQMVEQYQGPVYGFGTPRDGRASTRATYGEFKRFGTGAAIKKVGPGLRE